MAGQQDQKNPCLPYAIGILAGLASVITALVEGIRWVV